MIQCRPMPPEDVGLVLTAGAVDEKVRTLLLAGKIEEALGQIIKVDPSIKGKLNLTQSEIDQLGSIRAETMSDFSRQAMLGGLARGAEFL